MDLDNLPNWTLHEYCCECAGRMDERCIDAMAVDSKIPQFTFVIASSIINSWVR